MCQAGWINWGSIDIEINIENVTLKTWVKAESFYFNVYNMSQIKYPSFSDVPIHMCENQVVCALMN